MPNNPISIIIPVYNQAQELKKCLESILMQTLLRQGYCGRAYQNYEIIIVNDGSTDNTADAISEMQPKFKGVRYKVINQKNQGSNPARNRGADEARGDYIIFWDADVIAKPEMLAKMVDALEKNTQASYAYSSFIYGWKKFKLWPFNEDKMRAMPYIHSTSLIRREHFPGWDEKIKRLQDWDLWLTMLAEGHSGMWIPEYLFTVLTKSGTISQWIPKIFYKLPWLKGVKKYKEAVSIIKKKHKLNI